MEAVEAAVLAGAAVAREEPPAAVEQELEVVALAEEAGQEPAAQSAAVALVAAVAREPSVVAIALAVSP